jgi:lipid-A-disaccharide synthase
MKPKSIMLIAGEPSGDLLGAELVHALRAELTVADVSYTADSQPLRTGLEPHFFGAGGPHMAAAGVDLALNLTEHSIIGIPTLKTYWQGRQRFHQLIQLAIERHPDAIIGIDYNYFNLKFAHAIRQHLKDRTGPFHGWKPKLIKYISPQVWASRESRAFQIAHDYDLLLSLFPFEKDWYARRVPKLRVEFVGHPFVERFVKSANSPPPAPTVDGTRILLLPGSRRAELKRHIPVMLGALQLLRKEIPNLRAKIILPNDGLAEQVKSICPSNEVEIQVGGLFEELKQTDLAISKTGTITTECAIAGVPTITLYITSPFTYELGKRIVKVKSLTMPNLLAGEEVFPEFIQNAATPENISRAALELLRNPSRRKTIQAKLTQVVASLGGPGASKRAAKAILKVLSPEAAKRAALLPHGRIHG